MLFGVVTLSLAADLPEILEWSLWKETFEPHPLAAGVHNFSHREQVFKQTVRHILEHNAAEERDLTEEEFRSLLLRPFPSRQSSAREVWLHEIEAPHGDEIDWRTKNVVTPVKNQGGCGSCWAFSATGAMESHFAIATGSLRSLSEQQLMDCSKKFGNNACNGGLMDYAFNYTLSNGGLDSEDDYPYQGIAGPTCDPARSNRTMVTIDSFVDVPAGSEAQLAKALALGPVSVAIEADQGGFQSYKSGVFNASCGTKLDHGVLVVGLTPDAYIVKNSWGDSWGEKGYIRMKRNVNKTGICGIAEQASYPVKAKGTAPPIPVTSPPTPAPQYKCKCTASCVKTAAAFGMECCCGDGGNCHISQHVEGCCAPCKNSSSPFAIF